MHGIFLEAYPKKFKVVLLSGEERDLRKKGSLLFTMCIFVLFEFLLISM